MNKIKLEEITDYDHIGFIQLKKDRYAVVQYRNDEFGPTQNADLSKPHYRWSTNISKAEYLKQIAFSSTAYRFDTEEDLASWVQNKTDIVDGKLQKKS